MWAIEARNFGEKKDYFYQSGLTMKEAHRMIAKMSNSGNWASCRAWDKVAEWKQEEANERIRKFSGKLSV